MGVLAGGRGQDVDLSEGRSVDGMGVLSGRRGEGVGLAKGRSVDGMGVLTRRGSQDVCPSGRRPRAVEPSVGAFDVDCQGLGVLRMCVGSGDANAASVGRCGPNPHGDCGRCYLDSGAGKCGLSLS